MEGTPKNLNLLQESPNKSRRWQSAWVIYAGYRRAAHFQFFLFFLLTPTGLCGIMPYSKHK